MKLQLEVAEKQIIALNDQLIQLEKELEDKDAEISRLKNMLDSDVPSYLPVQNPVSLEEVIALKQIEVLHQASQTRPLSLEEVKILDLLVKNKRLAQGNTTSIIDTVKVPKEKAKLLEIAAKKINVEE